jgi:hypothetical protein
MELWMERDFDPTKLLTQTKHRAAWHHKAQHEQTFLIASRQVQTCWYNFNSFILTEQYNKPSNTIK